MNFTMNFNGAQLTKIYVALVGVVSAAGLIFVYAVPPESMKSDRDGIAHFTPRVLNPETGDPIEMGELIRHYRGD